jgi:CheY-like chemotaxis protein
MPPPKLDGLRVLVVDDNATNRRILTEVVTNWRMVPSAAEDGPTALAILRKAAGANTPFGLIILDCMMPGMDGFTVLEQIRQHAETARPTILMLSSADRKGDAARARELGAANYCVKPVKPSELLNAIVAALHVSGIRVVGPPEVAKPAETRRPSLHILLAEDSPINRLVVVRVLEKMGHRVSIANNGHEAVAAFEREPFDLVLMDVQMPELGGFEATAIIREKEQFTGKHIPIIALTAHAMKGDRERCHEAGMDGYVTKPVQPKDLFHEIEVVMGSRPRPTL